MRKIQNRTMLCILICFAFVLGLIYFMFVYARNVNNWTLENYYAAIGYDPNKAIENGTGSTYAMYFSTTNAKEKYYKRGVIVDKDGDLLAKVNEKEIIFSDDLNTRLAMLQTIGDREKNISTGAIRTYSDFFSRYVTKDGLYTAEDDGNTIKLTIDADINKLALKALGDYVGTVCFYNYKTGEVICMASTPVFDPDNIPEDILTNPKYSGAYINRCLSSSFTPGSTMKTVTLEAALDTIPDIDSKRFTCRGSYVINKQVVHCTGYHGTQDLKTAYANSCNCAFAQISQLIAPEALEHVVNSGGLTKSLTIDGRIKTGAGSFALVGENAFGFAWSAIGLHRDLNNPFNMMVYIGAIANGGQAAVPTLIEEITAPDGTVIRGLETTYTDQYIKKETADQMRAMMINNTVNHSSHYRTWNFKQRFGAKTGTVTRAAGGWNGWFVGFVDSEQYPYAFAVYVEKGGYGVTIAGGIASTIINTVCK